MAGNPVHEEGGKWFFWTEAWADREGPYDTRAEAEEALRRYVRWLDSLNSDARGEEGA